MVLVTPAAQQVLLLAVLSFVADSWQQRPRLQQRWLVCSYLENSHQAESCSPLQSAGIPMNRARIGSSIATLVRNAFLDRDQIS